MIKLNLPDPPSVNQLYRNRQQGVGRGRIKTDRYRIWLNAAGWEIVAQKPKAVNGPYELFVQLGPRRLRNGMQAARQKDLGNVLKAIEDLLVANNLVDDDSLSRRISIEWDERIDGCSVQVIPALSNVVCMEAAE